MKRIVLTTDFSTESKRAFGRAFDLARHMQLGVTLLHVVSDLKVRAQGAPLAPPQSDPDLQLHLEEAQREMEVIRQDLPADVNITTEVLSAENVAKAVARFAGDHDAELIVVSTHGRTGLRRFFLGSVAEQIVRYAPVPVLTVPPAQASQS